MPSNIRDQRRMSSFHISSAPSSFFSEEIPFPSERQIGLLKAESELNHCGFEGTPFISGIQSVSLSPQEKLRRMGGNPLECLQLPQAYALKDLKTKVSLKHHLIGAESIPDISMTSWRSHNHGFGPQPSLHVQPASHFVEGNKAGLNEVHHENGLFSSSLSDIFDKKLSLSSNGVPFGQSANILENNEPFQSLKEIEAQTIGSLLPDDDDLLSGVNDDFGCIVREDDIEEDLFCSGGGMELEADDRLNYKASDFIRGGALNGQLGPFAHEHPSGGYPSRTLFVRNINSNVEDAELRDLFEQYGDIHAFNTTCKYRGLLKISYYDIRAAQNAMRALQNKPLWHQNLAIQFYPKDNPSEKDSNPGTLVVFNLDSSVSNEDIHQIFGAYGEVKEVHDTPQKHHHKFIEFYDVRAAEAALHALNKSDIAGKRIKLESWQSCHTGDARWCLSRQFSPDLDREEFRLGSVPSTSSLECFVSSGLATLGMDISTGLDNAPIWALPSASHEFSSSIPHDLRPQVTLRNHSNQSGHTLGRNLSYQCAPTFHPHSLPECHGPVNNGFLFHHPRTMSTMDFMNSRPTDRINEGYIRHRVSSGGLDSHSFGHDDGAFGVVGNGSCPLQHQYVRNNPETHHPMMWQSSPSFGNSIPSQQMHGVPRAPTHMPSSSSSSILPFHHHYIGSAPAVNPSLWDNQHSYGADSLDNSFGSPMPALELASRNVFPHSGGNCAEAGIPSPRQRCQVFHGRNTYDAPNDRIRTRRSEANANQVDNKRLYDLDIDRIMLGTDSRTTLMIKNIPNKYTSKMLLATIDEHQRGTYDFIYLPIDFKNKCNVGYAFINMIDPQHIIPFFKAFNGKKWEKFNSEKVASLAYARIQGKAALIAHFQNSGLMNEDKRCRPILFHTDGPNAGDQEPFPMGVNVRSRPGRSRVAGNEEVHRGSPSTSMNGEGSHHA